jgi:MFS family permease
MGFINKEGVYTLNANHTALWGAMQSLGQFIGMVFLNPVSDRIGRKMTMYLLWVIVASVSLVYDANRSVLIYGTDVSSC